MPGTWWGLGKCLTHPPSIELESQETPSTIYEVTCRWLDNISKYKAGEGAKVEKF